MIKRMGVHLLARVDLTMKRARDRMLRAALGECGEGVVIRLPCVIEVPQSVFIEDNVSTGSYLHIWGNAGVRIGRNSMIASHVAITSATHDPAAPQMKSTMVSKPVTIGHDVWIGAHSIILPGVTVGEHAVVAAGSVVREDVPPYAIVAGVPAVMVRADRRSVESPSPQSVRIRQ